MGELDQFLKWCNEVTQGKHPDARDMYGRLMSRNDRFPYAQVSYWIDAYKKNKK